MSDSVGRPDICAASCQSHRWHAKDNDDTKKYVLQKYVPEPSLSLIQTLAEMGNNNRAHDILRVLPFHRAICIVSFKAVRSTAGFSIHPWFKANKTPYNTIMA